MTKHGQNAPCPCGSEQKYKHCHGDPLRQPVRMNELATGHTKAFSTRRCLHPEAGQGVCGRVISAHTVHRSSLAKIAIGGHVYGIRHSLGEVVKAKGKVPVRKIGIGQASTVTGFCDQHDSLLFAPVENRPFDATPEQCFLLAYRALCRELYLKESAIENYRTHLETAARLPLESALSVIGPLKERGAYMEISAEHLREYKQEFDVDLRERNFSNLQSLVLHLQTPPEVMCSSGIVPETDFLGKAIQDPYSVVALMTRLQALFISSIGTDKGGAVVLSWRKEHHTAPSALAASLLSLPSADIPSALVRFMFEVSENVYMHIPWWDGLADASRAELRRRMQSGLPGQPRPSGNRSLTGGPPLANWIITGQSCV